MLDAVELAREAIVEQNGHLDPFLILESNGLREVGRFAQGGIQGARAKAGEFRLTSGGDSRYALVHVGRVGHDADAIVVEVQETDDDEVHVFFQRFRSKGRLLRQIKLIGDVKSAGGRESSA